MAGLRRAVRFAAAQETAQDSPGLAGQRMSISSWLYLPPSSNGASETEHERRKAAIALGHEPVVSHRLVNELRHVVRSIAVRSAIRLAVVLTTITLAACGGGVAAPVPTAQRFLTAEDAPGTQPDPVETRQTTVDFDDFIATLSDIAVDPDRNEMTQVFQEAGFKGAGTDARFFGETHTQTEPHVFSTFIELESEDGARSALDWLETDSKKPCPQSCAVQISSFDVDDIADARGVHRIATAEDIADHGTKDEHPFDSYWVGFPLGSIVYIVDLHGSPGSVSEEQAQEIVSAYYDRLTGN
jgi:hypothetical protein